MIILMFIGASPGFYRRRDQNNDIYDYGWRVIAMMRGREDIVFFRYRLVQERIFKALTITLLALLFIIAVTMALSTTEDASFMMILFETTSAFGTVGLSLGLTLKLTTLGKLPDLFYDVCRKAWTNHISVCTRAEKG
ncbi:potassium transporter TrkG [Paenibacillus amylolyticus]|nr:potassium transporter TrkG [Paenibacillus amylolyticus]